MHQVAQEIGSMKSIGILCTLFTAKRICYFGNYIFR